jgi:hypothetical protein
MNLQELSERLGQKVPSTYSEFVLRGGPRRLDGTAASPAAVCAVNLEARAIVSAALAREGFFIFRLETGDLLLLEEADGKASIMEWSHETGDVYLLRESPEAVLAGLAQVSIADSSESGAKG